MATQNDPIKPMFGVPIGAFQIPNTSKLNKDLHDLILSSEKIKNQNLDPSQKIQPEVFESNFKFFDWDNPISAEIKKLMTQGVKHLIREVTSLTANELDKLKLFSDSWFHITRSGGYVQPHNHPNASWSAVYCVSDGNKTAEHEDSGALIFHNPIGSGYMYQDPTNRDFVFPYSIHGQKFILKPGQLIVFPSHLVHSVSPFYGDNERITIACNVWFER